MKIKFEKFLAITIISGIVFPSLSPALAQFDTTEWYADSLYNSGTTASPDNYVEERTGKDAEQAKAEAEQLKQLQKEDQQKCGSQTGLGADLGSKLANTLQASLQKMITSSVQELLPQELAPLLASGGKADLSASLKGILSSTEPANASANLSNNLSKIAKEKFQKNIQIALDSASAGGSVTLDNQLVKTIINEELDKSLSESLPEAINLSVKNGLPLAMKKSLSIAMPDAIKSGVTNSLKNNPDINRQLKEELHNRLGSDIFSLLSESTENKAVTIITSLIPGLPSTAPEFKPDSTSSELEDKTSKEITKITDELVKKLQSDEFNTQIDAALTAKFADGEILKGALQNLPLGMLGTNQSFANVADNPANNQFIDQAISSITSNGSINGIVDNLGSDVLGSLTSGITGQLDGVLGGVANDILGDALGPLTSTLDGVLGDVLSPITGALDDVLGTVLDPISGMLNDVMGTVLGPITGVLNGVMGSITGALSGVLGTTLGPLVGGGAAALGAGGAAAGLFVPTMEMPGQLTTITGQVQGNTDSTANNTGQIDKTTKSMEKLEIDICTKAKALERQSAANEQKNFVEDPKMHRDAALAEEQFRQAHSDWLNKGYDTDGDSKPDAPLYVQNYQDYVTNNREEAKNVYFDYMANTDDVFKDETQYVLRSEFSDQSSVSTVSKEDYQRFVTGQVTDPEEWSKLRLAINDISRPNSPETSARINREKITSYIAKKEEEAKNQLAIGEGYLPVRNCIEKTDDNTACKRWETVTPQVQVKETTAKVYDYRIDNYVNPQTGDVAPGNEPQIEELLNFKPSTSGGGGAAPSGKNIASIIKTLLSLIRNISGEGPTPDLPTGQVTFSVNTTSFSGVQAGQVANTSTLTWSTTNVKSCKVVGGWVSKSGSNALTSVNRDGDPLPLIGSYIVNLPLTYDARLTRIRDNTPNFLTISNSLVSLAYDKKTIEIATTSLQTGDKLSIGFWPFVAETSVEITVGTVDAGTIANQLQSAINSIKITGENLNQKNLFNLYTFTVTDGKIEITPNLTYKMSCVYDGVNETTGEVEEKTLVKEVTIKR